MCLSCGKESDEPLCSPCLKAIFCDKPLWLYPHTISGSGLAQILAQEAALSSDGTITIQRSHMNLKETIDKFDPRNREKANMASEYLNGLLLQIGVPLKLNMYEPIILLEDDKELIEVLFKNMESDILCGNRKLCLRMGNILWHYGHGLKESGLKLPDSKAEELFKAALKYYFKASSFKNDVVAFGNIAIALYALKDYKRSLEYCDKALMYGDAQLYLVKGLSLYGIGKMDEALANLNRVIELNPSPPMLLELGKILASIGNSEEALASFDEALKRDEDSEDALLSKYELLAKMGMENEAEEFLRKIKERGIEPRPVRELSPPEVSEVEEEEELEREIEEEFEGKREEHKAVIEEYEEEEPELEDQRDEDIESTDELKSEIEQPDKEPADEEPPASPTQMEKAFKPHEDWREMMSKAKGHMKIQEYEEALSCYNAASKLRPKNVQIWIKKAKALEHLEMYEEALQGYDHILKVNAKDEKIWKQKITLLKKSGRFDEAIDAYKELISMFPKNEEIQNEMAKLFMDLGRFEKAAACFESITKKHPANLEFHLNLGNALLRLDRDDEANQCFNKAAEIDPRNAEAWFNRGLIQNKRGKWGAALQFFNWAIALKEGFGEAWISKADVLKEHDELEEVLYCYDKVIRLEPKNEGVWYSKAKVLWELGRHREALKCIDALLKLSPKSEVASEIKARMAEKLKDRKTELMKDEEYLMGKAGALHREGSLKDALKLLALVSKLNPRNEAALLRTAEILVQDGKFERALKKYTLLLNINPKNREALTAKALLYMRLDLYKEALLCFDHLLKLNPGDERAKRHKEDCLRELKESKDDTKRSIEGYGS